MPHFLPVSDPSSSRLNLRRLVWLRLAFNGGEALVLLLAYALFDLPLPYAALLALIALHLLVSAFTLRRLVRPSEVAEWELFLHLVTDMVLFAALLALSGGAANPFAFLLLLPLTIAAAALPRGWTWGMALIAIGLYSLLIVVYQTWAEASAHGFHLHVLGMWLGFVLSAGLIATFVTRMGAVLREQERRLAQAREQSLRDERLLALGALAAGAAHDLGTPLATMAVVTEELVHDSGPDSVLGRRLGIVRGQIERCKKVLAELAERAGEQPAVAGQKQRLAEYLDGLLQDWQRQHPAVHCAVAWRGPPPGPWIVADLTLDQALRNLLNNAAEASPWRVEITAEWNDDGLQLQIGDQGPGFSPASLPQVGRAVFSTKARGRGLGLLLSQSTLTRFGGHIAFGNRAEGGACVTVVLPLARIRITHDAS